MAIKVSALPTFFGIERRSARSTSLRSRRLEIPPFDRAQGKLSARDDKRVKSGRTAQQNSARSSEGGYLTMPPLTAGSWVTEPERNLYGRRKAVERVGRREKTGGKGRDEQSGTRRGRRGGRPKPPNGGVVLQMRHDFLCRSGLEVVYLLEMRRDELRDRDGVMGRR